MERRKLAHLLRACSKSRIFHGGLQIHAALAKAGLHADLILCNDLVDMYCRCGRLDMAGEMFDGMLHRNVVSWTVLMAGRLQVGLVDESLELFREMIFAGARPNEFTLSTHLKACGFSGAAGCGKVAHGLCVKTGFEGHTVVANSISHMYSRSGMIEDAKRMFGAMPTRNLVSWNAMIAGFVLEGDGRSALRLFGEMRSRREEAPDEFTFSSLLKACSGLSAARAGTQVHAALITRAYEGSENSILAGALIDLYVKCGRISEARKVFDRAAHKNAVLWTALVAGYGEEGLLEEAMEIFIQIRRSGSQTDAFLLSTLTGMFADLALVSQGRQVHAHSVKLPAGSDVSVANSILDMYFKCGHVEDATQFFAEMPLRNLISWTAAIDGHGKHGGGRKSIRLFEQMEEEGVDPDGVAYLALLSACSHAGLVEDCRRYYSRLKRDERIRVKLEHHACVVDLLGRVGNLDEARELTATIPGEPCAGLWQTLLSACRLHKNLDMGRDVLGVLARLDGENAVNYVIMANILADAGRWEECGEMREMMKRKKMKKQGGCSWIEVEKSVHSFFGGDDSHPRIEEIKAALREVEKRMREEGGYVAGAVLRWSGEEGSGMGSEELESLRVSG